jgi:hypothetical protein
VWTSKETSILKSPRPTTTRPAKPADNLCVWYLWQTYMTSWWTVFLKPAVRFLVDVESKPTLLLYIFRALLSSCAFIIYLYARVSTNAEFDCEPSIENLPMFDFAVLACDSVRPHGISTKTVHQNSMLVVNIGSVKLALFSVIFDLRTQPWTRQENRVHVVGWFYWIALDVYHRLPVSN